MTRSAPESSAIAATPEAGLISGVLTRSRKSERGETCIKSNSMLMDLKTDLLDGEICWWSSVDAFTSRSSMACC